MNVFYVEPAKVTGNRFELTGQEAQHAAKVLRLKTGDNINATDGQGKSFTGEILHVNRDSVTALIKTTKEIPQPNPRLVLAMGIIKKRDRLEFAVEKAVELGASEIVLFSSDHSEKTKIRLDRIENIIISAMKQSLRVWLPKVSVLDSLDKVLGEYSAHEFLMAHEKAERISNIEQGTPNLEQRKKLLMVGPEGGFSDREVELVEKKGGKLISLGKFRLRAETAVVAFLSQYL